MKKTLLRISLPLLAVALALGTARAQQAVPNGPLENWVARNGGEAPAQWQTTDDVLRLGIPGLPPTGAVTKSTSSHAGSFAAKLTNINLVGLGSAPGFLALGNAIGSVAHADSLEDIGGLPYTSRPARLQFYYKFSGTTGRLSDRPVAGILLTRTSGGVRQVVARGKLFLPVAAANYTLVEIPLRYLAGFAPDSVHITFGSGDYDRNDFTPGNTLFIDDVALVGTVTATRDAQLQAAVRAFPNPSATGFFTLQASQEVALLAAPLTVTDALGRVVLQLPADRSLATGLRTVDLRPQPAGVYSLRLDTPRGPITQQLLIE